LGLPPTEAQSLLRLIFAALADVDGALIGAPESGESSRAELADKIMERGEEIARIAKA
jgi:hypothetical protein